MVDLSKFRNKTLLEKTLNVIQKKYRPYDPESYLYRQVFDYTGDKYSKEFIELVYVTLSAWNMNSRGAKLNDFHLFEQTILDNKYLLNKLKNKTIVDIENIDSIINELFFRLKLVYKNKPLLVTFSKIIHFYFPNLLVPIDRTYTCNYFFGHTSIPSKLEGQYKKLMQIEKEFSIFLKENDLKKYISKNWNLCETKIMDNMIIGYIKLKNKK